MKETILHTPQNIAFSKEIVKHLPQAIRRRLPAEISVVSVSEKESRRLNRRYRGKSKPANVLSFLYSDTILSSPRTRGSRKRNTGFPIKSGMTMDKDGVHRYGEIIVCPPVIRREAWKQKHSFQYQMTWMIAHGMIHLSGLHHEVSEDSAKRVERLEQSVLSKVYASLKTPNSKHQITNKFKTPKFQ